MNGGILGYPPLDEVREARGRGIVARGRAGIGAAAPVPLGAGLAFAGGRLVGGALVEERAWRITSGITALEIELPDAPAVWQIEWCGVTIDDTAHSSGQPYWVADWWLWDAADYDATARPTAGRRWGNGGTASVITLSLAYTVLSEVYFSAGYPGTMVVEGQCRLDNRLAQGVRRLDIPYSIGWFNSGAMPRIATYRLMSATADSSPAATTPRLRKVRLRMSDNKLWTGRVGLYRAAMGE